jgi:secondary thiamine-phosphate synthase enzyme
MDKIIIKTSEDNEIVDITEKLNSYLKGSKKEKGIIYLQLLHTTAALTTADLDPGTDQDMLDAWYGMLPDIEYRHSHNPEHTPDHILSSLIGPSLTLFFNNSELQLGTWQRIVLCEFDGPRERELLVGFHQLP